MKARLAIILVIGVLSAGCGVTKDIYTTTTKQVQNADVNRDSLAKQFKQKANNFELNMEAQEHNAPFKPGYNVNDETAPLTGMAPVIDNIAKDWALIREIMDGQEPYDYELLGTLGAKLVMRAQELQNGRKIELRESGVDPLKYEKESKDDPTDRAIIRFGVLAKRFMTAAATRRRDELIEVYTVFPMSTPFIKLVTSASKTKTN